MRVLIGHDPAVSAYIAEATGDPLHAPFRTIGIYSGQKLIGGWALDEYTGYGVNLSGAGRGTMLREARQVLCDLVYGTLGCRRMAITIRRSNRRMRKMAARLGFVFEGISRGYYGSEDGIVLSMLSSEAASLGHWLPHPLAGFSRPPGDNAINKVMGVSEHLRQRSGAEPGDPMVLPNALNVGSGELGLVMGFPPRNGGDGLGSPFGVGVDGREFW